MQEKNRILHYFFLPQNLSFMKDWFNNGQNIIVEILITALIATAIITICLLLSYIIRTSKFLSHYLWGTKYKIEEKKI